MCSCKLCVEGILLQFVSRLLAVFQALTGQAPAYLADDCHLTWTDTNSALMILEPVTRRICTQFSDRSFSDAGLQVEQFTTCTPGSRLDFRLFQTRASDLSVYTGVMKSQCLVTIDFWHYINSHYVCMYVSISHNFNFIPIKPSRIQSPHGIRMCT